MATVSDRTAQPGQLASVWTGLVRDEHHGALPVLLLGLTIVTGVVDAVSILALGRVFVANMTGNVVFVGFAIAGAPGFSLGASLSALAGFLIGAFAGGRVIVPMSNRAVQLRSAVAAQSVLVAAALVIALAVGTPFGDGARDGIAALLAIAMGVQNSTARKLAVPDLTTTVLTMTLTGIAADAHDAAHGPVIARRTLAVATMVAGAICGALLVLEVSAAAALAVATGLLAAVTAGATVVARRPACWQ